MSSTNLEGLVKESLLSYQASSQKEDVTLDLRTVGTPAAFPHTPPQIIPAQIQGWSHSREAQLREHTEQWPH